MLLMTVLSTVCYRKNETEADLISVEHETWPLTYVYEPRDLLLAYGLSLLCAACCTIMGLHAFWVNHASYQNLFSTFLRTTKNDTALSFVICDYDSGADPLPKELAKTRVSIGGGGQAVASEHGVTMNGHTGGKS